MLPCGKTHHIRHEPTWTNRNFLFEPRPLKQIIRPKTECKTTKTIFWGESGLSSSYFIIRSAGVKGSLFSEIQLHTLRWGYQGDFEQSRRRPFPKVHEGRQHHCQSSQGQ
ncbi:MAG: hypothetical protein D6706_12170 [Chloroflexi bacterium]|nr:MAG: hypothetical protein D6706_12170 [Chloroflexota bacterium]